MENKLQSFSEEIYSTYPEFEYEYENVNEPKTLPPSKQELTISVKERKIDGVIMTTISGFVGRRIDLLLIEQALQEICKTCGSSKMYDIVLFRDVSKRAFVYLRNQGYNVQITDS